APSRKASVSSFGGEVSGEVRPVFADVAVFDELQDVAFRITDEGEKGARAYLDALLAAEEGHTRCLQPRDHGVEVIDDEGDVGDAPAAQNPFCRLRAFRPGYGLNELQALAPGRLQTGHAIAILCHAGRRGFLPRHLVLVDRLTAQHVHVERPQTIEIIAADADLDGC